MSKNRDELSEGLASVDRKMGALMADFWSTFAGETEPLLEDATEADVDWLNAEIDKILLRHGIALPENDLPPDE